MCVRRELEATTFEANFASLCWISGIPRVPAKLVWFATAVVRAHQHPRLIRVAILPAPCSRKADYRHFGLGRTLNFLVLSKSGANTWMLSSARAKAALCAGNPAAAPWRNGHAVTFLDGRSPEERLSAQASVSQAFRGILSEYLLLLELLL